MKSSNHRILVLATIFLTMSYGASVAAEEVAAAAVPASSEKFASDKLVDRATNLLEKQMAEIPSKRIPLYIRRTSQCIAVFPSVIKAGIIIAGQRGQGLVTCRHKESDEWGAPAYFNFTAASVGIQAGIQQASIVMIALTRNGVEAFINEDIGFDGNVTVAAGPVGGGASRSSLPAVASYVRTQGLFAGIDLSGSNISFAIKANAAAYGDTVSVRSILFENSEVPASLVKFQQALVKFAPKSGVTSPDEE